MLLKRNNGLCLGSARFSLFNARLTPSDSLVDFFFPDETKTKNNQRSNEVINFILIKPSNVHYLRIANQKHFRFTFKLCLLLKTFWA